MVISTRGRYALRVMIELAEHGDEFVPLKMLADRQQISRKYLEHILPLLGRNSLVLAAQGKGGGYRLARKPADYTVGEILTATEMGFSPVACLENGATPCPRAEKCKTLPMWREFMSVTRNFFDRITLEDLIFQKGILKTNLNNEVE